MEVVETALWDAVLDLDGALDVGLLRVVLIFSHHIKVVFDRWRKCVGQLLLQVIFDHGLVCLGGRHWLRVNVLALHGVGVGA